MMAAPLYIGLIELELLLGQLPVLQHSVRQADGPHLMQQARIVAVPAGRFVQTHPTGKLLRQRGHLFAVQVHFRHFGAEGAVHGRDDLERHLREPGPLGIYARLQNDMLLQLFHPVALDEEGDDVGDAQNAQEQEGQAGHKIRPIAGGGVCHKDAPQAEHDARQPQQTEGSTARDAQDEHVAEQVDEQEKDAEIPDGSLPE